MQNHNYTFDNYLVDENMDLKKRIEVAKEILREIVDHMGEECRHDHHGYCQEHALQDRDNCMIKRAVDFIRE